VVFSSRGLSWCVLALTFLCLGVFVVMEWEQFYQCRGGNMGVS
jgi:hypothetical protein